MPCQHCVLFESSLHDRLSIFVTQIEDGEIFANINQRDDMVSFHDNPEKYSSISTLGVLDEQVVVVPFYYGPLLWLSGGHWSIISACSSKTVGEIEKCLQATCQATSELLFTAISSAHWLMTRPVEARLCMYPADPSTDRPTFFALR